MIKVNDEGLVITNGFGPCPVVTYHPEMDKLKVGDLFCTHNPMALGAAINKIEGLWASDGTATYSHSGIIVGANGMTLEADWLLENFCLFDKFQGQGMLIARYNGMDDAKFLAGMLGVQDNIGESYPILRLILQAMRVARIFHWNKVVCSEFVAKFLYYVGARHHHYFGVNPDDLADEFHNMLNTDRNGPRYEIIFEGTLPILRYRFCSFCHKVYQVLPDQKHCHGHVLPGGQDNILPWDSDHYLPDQLRKINDQRGLG